ncbi:MAG: 3-isopropylmalate dehydratase small subunit [Verrucomicrobiales bacterium]|nr:MAG: 3-isopropylmalate dehydratase small subunit [Verrucomicrobiaceae bacterium]
MSLEKIKKVSGRSVYVPGNDIDTDRIIPARFMKCVTFDGLGEYLFYDVRKDSEGNDKEHPLNEPRFFGASVLISNANFGCGSSREHAPQALYRYGFRAVIAESFAEIFFGNCCALGMPCVLATQESIKALTEIINAAPKTEVSIDVVNSEVCAGDLKFPVEIPVGAKEALTNGRWDPIAELQEAEDSIDDLVIQLGYLKKS